MFLHKKKTSNVIKKNATSTLLLTRMMENKEKSNKGAASKLNSFWFRFVRENDFYYSDEKSVNLANSFAYFSSDSIHKTKQAAAKAAKAKRIQRRLIKRGRRQKN